MTADLKPGSSGGLPDRDLLASLERARDRYGCLPGEALAKVAGQMNVPLVEVFAAASFYRSLPLGRRGKHVVRVCRSVPCHLKAGRRVIEAIERDLGIGPGETSDDGVFSLELVDCIGACDGAPAMMVDDDRFGDLTPERAKQVLDTYRQA